MILCVQIPRFELTVAVGGPEALAGRAVAIAPKSVSSQLIGEVSGTAQAAGVRAGMRLGEALARCPELALVPEDPVGVAEIWERAVCALEGIGAAVEAPRPGLAYFKADGLTRLHGDLSGLLAAVRRTLGRSVWIGGGSTRLCALAAAAQARPRRARVIEERDTRRYLGAQAVSILAFNPGTEALVAPLEQLGVRTLQEFLAMGAAATSDRFGRAGMLARKLAAGCDDPLRPRRPEERLDVSMPVGETNSSSALERTLAVLIDRVLTAGHRRGRTVRALLLWARLVERGTWREQIVLREPIADPVRLRLALAPRLGWLPAPAQQLGLMVSEWGPAEGDQQSLLNNRSEARLERLRNAIEQTRTAVGAHSVLRALEVDPESRVPERRYTYTPFLQ